MNAPLTSGQSEPTAGAAAGEATSLTLLERVRQSDQAAWSRLVRLYGPLVFDWCVRAGLKSNDAADVGQEVFTRVWSAIGGFRRERPGDTFRGWLRVITKRQVLDFWRRRQRQPAALTNEPEDLVRQHVALTADESDEQLAEERRQLYLRAVALLRSDFEPITVDAFWRVVVEGQPAREVAGQLQISINAVYIAKSRVLTRLRAELADEAMETEQ